MAELFDKVAMFWRKWKAERRGAKAMSAVQKSRSEKMFPGRRTPGPYESRQTLEKIAEKPNQERKNATRERIGSGSFKHKKLPPSQ